jgi:glutathione synthase/RimK-type ligase-like ATP-grasp enzyme
MSLCIIGQEKSETNIKLLEEAKKKFRTVFFTPITGIAIGLTDKFSINYRKTDLFRFRAVLPRISKNYCSYAYQLLSLFPSETFMPVKPISFLLSEERFFLLTVLRKRGIPTLNLHLSRSTRAVESVIEGSKYPCMIRTPDKKTGVIVKNSTEAKSVIDTLTHLNKHVLIEDIVDDVTSVYVSEPHVLAAVKRKTKESDKVFGVGELRNQKIDIETGQLALEAAKAIDAQIARIDISTSDSPKIVNIELNPDLIRPSKVVEINLPRKVIESMAENYADHQKKPLLMKFFEDARSVVKDVLGSKELI